MRRFQRVSDGPICSEGEFNDFLCSDPRRTASPWIKMLRSFLKEDHRLVRTHGDLHPRNIMVEWVEGEEGGPAEQTDKRVRITSLIDLGSGRLVSGILGICQGAGYFGPKEPVGGLVRLPSRGGHRKLASGVLLGLSDQSLVWMTLQFPHLGT